MRLDIPQTLVAAAVIALLYFMWIRRAEAFEDSASNDATSASLKVIPKDLTAKDAAASLFKNINFEITNYLKPVVDATNRLATLRPKLKLDKTLIDVQNNLRKISNSNEVAAVKMMSMAEALPPSVDIYKKTYDDLIHATVNEYDLVLSASASASTSGFIDMTKDPAKAVNEYNRISNTRMDALNFQEEAFKKAADDFEAAFARLRTLIEQSK